VTGDSTRTPPTLSAAEHVRAAAGGPPHRVTLELPFRRPFNPDNLFGHLAATAVPGVEEVRAGAYRRTLRLAHGPGIAELTPGDDEVACRLILAHPGDLGAAIDRCRWLLDLDADPSAIDGRLARDPVLAPLVTGAPGRRIPRTVNGPELAIRAVLGQQISTAAARTLGARLTIEFGEPIVDPDGGLTHLFPTPASLREARLAGPASRGRTLTALASALASGDLMADPGAGVAQARAVLVRVPGIGPWTTEIIVMRALGDGDAFPASDLGVRRAAEALGLPTAPGALAKRSRGWAPWRAYAVQYLWSVLPHAINRWPPPPVGDSADDDGAPSIS